jgi:hypothetical protein
VFHIRPGGLRRTFWGVLACTLLFGSQSAPAQDVNIIAPTTSFSNYNVGGQLTVSNTGSLMVFGSLDVGSNIINSGSSPGIDVTGSLFSGGNVINQADVTFLIQGTGASSVAGSLFNFG